MLQTRREGAPFPLSPSPHACMARLGSEPESLAGRAAGYWTCPVGIEARLLVMTKDLADARGIWSSSQRRRLLMAAWTGGVRPSGMDSLRRWTWRSQTGRIEVVPMNCSPWNVHGPSMCSGPDDLRTRGVDFFPS